MAVKITSSDKVAKPRKRGPTPEDWKQFWEEFEIARQGGRSKNLLSKSRQRYLSHMSRGICGACGKRPLVTQTYCEECRKKRNDRYHERMGPSPRPAKYKSRKHLRQQLSSLKIGDSLIVPGEDTPSEKLRRRILSITRKKDLDISIVMKILAEGVEVTRVKRPAKLRFF